MIGYTHFDGVCCTVLAYVSNTSWYTLSLFSMFGVLRLSALFLPSYWGFSVPLYVCRSPAVPHTSMQQDAEIQSHTLNKIWGNQNVLLFRHLMITDSRSRSLLSSCESTVTDVTQLKNICVAVSIMWRVVWCMVHVSSLVKDAQLFGGCVFNSSDVRRFVIIIKLLDL
jgi:hypothetical protein